MYARLVMFTIGAEMGSKAEEMVDQFASILKTLKGFIRETFIGDDTTSEYGCLSLWESKEDAEAAAAVLGPKLEQALSGIAKEPPTAKLFKVYEPKA